MGAGAARTPRSGRRRPSATQQIPVPAELKGFVERWHLVLADAVVPFVGEVVDAVRQGGGAQAGGVAAAQPAAGAVQVGR